MSTALAVVNPRDLMTPDDIEILRKSKFKGFSDAEVAYAVKICNHLNLNPLVNQIHFVKRGQAVTTQVAIDGLRLGAQRTGEYAGSDDAIYGYAKGDTTQKKPSIATVTVYRMIAGQRCPFTATARWEEYYQPQGGMWDRMPHVMLAKCAESQALRKAFPAELSNVYSHEEMGQADGKNKAASVQEQLQGKKPEEPGVIETEGRVIDESSDEEPPPEGACPACGGSNVMDSRYVAGQVYCKSCKHKFPKVTP
jgi:phage recombination protein Bet